MTIEINKILVVEDNPGDYHLIKEWLKAGGVKAELVNAENLNHALISLSESFFELILLDLRLPDSDGLGTFMNIYSHASESPIIVLTGIVDEELGINAVHEGAEDYLLKNELNTKMLIRSIKYALERKRLMKELQKKVRELERVNRILAFGRDMEIEELRMELRRLQKEQENK